MGRALARQLAARGDELFLLGRDPDDLQRSARDLEVRAGRALGTVGTAICDI
jgi:short-subunit dehydrogenase